MLVNLLSFDLGVPTCLSTLEVLQASEHAPTPSSSVVFTFGLAVESIKELGDASMLVWLCNTPASFKRYVIEPK